MTTAPTHTREGQSVTRVRVERPAGGGRAQVLMSAAGPVDRPVLRPVLVASDAAGATVSLVPEGALLLGGDAIRIEISVGPGARLEIIEPGGTVAYPMVDDAASWDVVVDVGAGGRLVWAGEPFVVAAGATVVRRTSVALGWSASMVLRETLVLGRHGEEAGRLSQETVVSGAHGQAVFADGLELGPDTTPLLLGGARAVGTVLVLGARLSASVAEPQSRFELEAVGTMVRMLAADAHRAVPVGAWVEARALPR